ncbi:MAG: class I tRNA ligase family protein [Euryarchaeota archaeon]|nr:class I tRNA ligase family protein [Euryarchaeota archaeon]MDE2044990.1 class I tRNA ligase family protein [Thermoplasmata archaeon]
MTGEIESRERAWQARWKEVGLGKARAQPGHPKFSLVFAYPGTSGFMHVGHMRGYTFADMIARFHRMKGEEVFFPAGIHASGLPAVIFAGKVARRDPDTIEGLKHWGARDEDLPGLEDPATASRFLARTYWKVWERFGLILDESANVSTIDSDYQQFIRWQFLRLERLGRLVQKPYFAAFCPRSGPVSVDPSETDLERGGNAEIVAYTALPFRLPDGRFLLCATLRPETVYGATNVWVPTEGSLFEWSHDGRTYLVSETGREKLLEQVGGERGADVAVDALITQEVEAPLTGEKMRLLKSPLVDPHVGSGAVMSVPAHAPADWVAVQELEEPTRSLLASHAKVLLTLPEESLAPSERELFRGDGPPAAQAVRSLGVKGLSDTERLQEATERVYRAEHAHGVMTVLGHEGESVQRARERVAEAALARVGAVEIREFSEPVVCRCGETVIIRKVPDQWFLAYGNGGWKDQVRAHLRGMSVYPAEYRDELPRILDWFEDRPAVRRGKWLGTPFPKDPRWIIEPIADSTFYPAYYVVRRFVSAGKLKVEELTPEFFDYVFRGEGDGGGHVGSDLLEEVRREFLYFYPLDLNLGGKEHKRVHFPPFLYNHVALLPPELCPRGIFVNWWITRDQAKVSKKDIKGGALPTVDRALSDLGADGLRLYYAIASTSSQDIEWDLPSAERYAERAQEALRSVRPLLEGLSSWTLPSLELSTHVDRWFSSALAGATRRAREAFEENDLRSAAEVVYVEIPGLIRRYRAKGGKEATLLRGAGSLWVRLLSPITPHLAEEAASSSGLGLVATAPFPGPDVLPIFPEAMAREAMVDLLEDDVQSLLKAWKSPVAELRVFVASGWKTEAERALLDAFRGGTAHDLGSVMKVLRTHETLKSHLPDLPAWLKLYDLRELAVASSKRGPPLAPAEEQALWNESVPYLRERFGLATVSVLKEEDAASADPKGRRLRARPGRPALFLVEPATKGLLPGPR